MVFLLSGALMALVGTAARYVNRSQEAADAMLIGQEVMETLKANARFHRGIPVPAEVERNGRTYRVEVQREIEMVEGLPLEMAAVTVGHAGGAVTFHHVLGRRGGSYGE